MPRPAPFYLYHLAEQTWNTQRLTADTSPALGKTHKSTVKAAVLNHGLPNFFFHLVTGYSIIRSKGVPVGKADYLSSFLGL